MAILNQIFNESNLDTINRIKENNVEIDVVLTSPPYNTSYVHGSDDWMTRYKAYSDDLSSEEYISTTINLFCEISKVLKPDGVILYNMSYGARQTELWIRTVSAIIEKTPFNLYDTLVWKKSTCQPDNRSKNKASRICEFVFVFALTPNFKTNKEYQGLSKGKVPMYKPFYNLIEAKNNDGSQNLNKATYSTDLCNKLLTIYSKPGETVFDPYNGIGTTCFAAKQMGLNYIGCDIEKEQCEYAIQKLDQLLPLISIV
jgi:DNA modification methylase